MFGKKKSGGCCNMEIVEDIECDCSNDKISEAKNIKSVEGQVDGKKSN